LNRGRWPQFKATRCAGGGLLCSLKIGTFCDEALFPEDLEAGEARAKLLSILLCQQRNNVPPDQLKKGRGMDEETKIDDQSGVDRGLIAMFLKMSPEERLLANDNAVRAILELRDAYRRQKAHERKLK
jgi:hypothetical protein